MIAVLVYCALVGMASAATPTPLAVSNNNPFSGSNYDLQEKNVTFNYEESVKGNGFYNTYKYAKMGALVFKNNIHGSGSIENEAVLFAQELYTNYHPFADDWKDGNLSCITYKEDNNMVYAPVPIAVGTFYYAKNPIKFDSLIHEADFIKNYRAATSMCHDVLYAHALTKELDIIAKEKWNVTYDPVWVGNGYTQMKIEEDVTDGKVHFGVLQGSNPPTTDINPFDYRPRRSAWYKPAVDIDEDYWGTYHIVKNLTLEVPYYRKTSTEDWLPCCPGGFYDMHVHDRKYTSADRIFDCSCRDYSISKMVGGLNDGKQTAETPSVTPGFASAKTYP
jgi:hypothetical protein